MAGSAEFTHIVIGAGAAGCVVAARLAEDSARLVLLLEAGPDLRTEIPDSMRDCWTFDRRQPWGYESEPDANGNVEPLHRGRLVGGTSWVTRFALRGSPADYDGWARRGNDRWGFEQVLASFRRVERDLDFGDRPWHGADGPMPITRYRDIDPGDYEAAMYRGCEAAGIPLVEDQNRPNSIGVGRIPLTSQGGVRATTADVYLPVGATPSNLVVRGEAQVADVVLDGNRAVGVRLLDGSVLRGDEVVLCAGVYGSPAILMRSGVGPAQHLRDLGIAVVAELPGVGENLSDHPAVDVDPGFSGRQQRDAVVHSIATFRSSVAESDEPPDLAFWFCDPAGDPAGASIDVVLLTPRSRGRVRLRSADPTAHPRITLPGVHDPLDRRRLREGFLGAWGIARSEEVRRVCTRAPSPIVDASSIDEMVAAESYSDPHTVGTCAMGPDPDQGAVVDQFGRVHGVDRLRVVDASIIPTAPSGFPHLVTIMLADRLHTTEIPPPP